MLSLLRFRLPTGRERQLEALRPYQYKPGESGNSHRGPDRFKRRNVVRAIMLAALGSAQERPVEVKVRVKGKVRVRKSKAMVQAAMLQDLIGRL